MSTAVSKDSVTTTNEAGTAPVGDPQSPLSKYNGQLQQDPTEPPVYLCLNASFCWVPDPTTLSNLFVPNATIIQNIDIGEIMPGTSLTSGALLAQVDGTSPCYLITNGQKWLIPSADVFTAYQFNSKNIQSFPQIILDSIPNGPNVEGPTS